jgi:hypothetical protein
MVEDMLVFMIAEAVRKALHEGRLGELGPKENRGMAVRFFAQFRKHYPNTFWG